MSAVDVLADRDTALAAMNDLCRRSNGPNALLGNCIAFFGAHVAVIQRGETPRPMAEKMTDLDAESQEIVRAALARCKGGGA